MRVEYLGKISLADGDWDANLLEEQCRERWAMKITSLRVEMGNPERL